MPPSPPPSPSGGRGGQREEEERDEPGKHLPQPHLQGAEPGAGAGFDFSAVERRQLSDRERPLSPGPGAGGSDRNGGVSDPGDGGAVFGGPGPLRGGRDLAARGAYSQGDGAAGGEISLAGSSPPP